jgi:hypothetical protein
MTVVIDGTEYIPAAVAAERLATTELKILMLLREKVLVGEAVEGAWFVTKTSVDSYRPEAVTPTKAHCSTGCSSSHCGCR